ncbi:MAG: ATP-binding protein [Alphaproteobacteria bacterium]
MIALVVLLSSIVQSRRVSVEAYVQSQQYAKIISQTDALIQGVTDAETGQRGYELTHLAIYLEPFQSGQALAALAEKSLRELMARAAIPADPALEKSFNELIEKKAAALEIIQRNAQLTEAGKGRRTLNSILLNDGKTRMDSLRAAASDFRDRTNAKLESRTDFIALNRARTDSMMFTLIGVVLFSALLGGWVLMREAAVLRAVGEELSKANAEALAAKQRAEEADAAKTRFLAMASHDMRQPLHALTLYLSSLKRRVDGAQAKDIVVNIEKAAESLTRMFSGLLDLARIEAGVLKPSMANVAVAEIFDALERELRNDAERERVRLLIAPTSLKIVTDPELMQSVLRNLLTNAIKYAPGGRVLLGVRRAGARARIEVHDEGPGIPEEKLVLMFGEFVRLERSGAVDKEGLGLGLSIASRLANLLDGDLEVSSEVGKGTSFCIFAPIAHDPAVRELLPPPEPRNLTGIRVAVLDDEPDSLGAMIRVIDDAGGAATGFGFAHRYVEAVHAGARFNLLIADPALRSQAHAALGGADDTPVIIVTGATDVSTLERLEKSGAPWLVKPISEGQLIAQAAKYASPAEAVG